MAVEKVGRAEHGKDMVERIQVVRWRNRERGLKEGTNYGEGGDDVDAGKTSRSIVSEIP